RYIGYFLKGAERLTDEFLSFRCRDPKSELYGGIPEDIINVKPTVYRLTTSLSAYLYEGGRYYHDEGLLAAIDEGIEFVGRNQRESGLFDYPVCNFHSAADTSFCLKRLIDAYLLMEKYGGGERLSALIEKYRNIIRKAALGVTTGGFHTPNHRWAIAAALLRTANIFAADTEFAGKLRERAEMYLSEGVDCDADGEYSERSTGNYNAVVNRALIDIYEATGDGKYIEYVCRNLDMMLHYIERDGTIFTESSTRQDRGRRIYADKYFYQFLYAASSGMALPEYACEFDAAAHKLISDASARGDMAPDCLFFLMLHNRALSHSFEGCGFLPEYRKFFGESGILRAANKKYSLTVMKGSSSFVHFAAGDLKITVKIAESICEVRNFIPKDIECRSDGCLLSGVTDDWYYLPRGVPTEAFDNASRERMIADRLKTTVDVCEGENGIELLIKAEGLDRVPIRCEICVSPGTGISNDCISFYAWENGDALFHSGHLDLSGWGHTVRLEGGFCEHEFKGHYSGEEPRGGSFVIFANAYTPTEKRLSLKVL
ncbi:MAG: hypothetical protein LUH54_03085, partial [Firmicutes bacterium]|nr:hypothetical protein [Bacillota bacterium]